MKIDRSSFFAANFISKGLRKYFYKNFLLPKIKDSTKILCYEILKPYSMAYNVYLSDITLLHTCSVLILFTAQASISFKCLNMHIATPTFIPQVFHPVANVHITTQLLK